MIHQTQAFLKYQAGVCYVFDISKNVCYVLFLIYQKCLLCSFFDILKSFCNYTQPLLPVFEKYYSALGVSNFLIFRGVAGVAEYSCISQCESFRLSENIVCGTNGEPKLGHPRDCSGKQNQVECSFHDFWPKPGPGRLPLDSGRGDVEFASVFCVCSVLGGQIRVRMHILEPCLIHTHIALHKCS